MTEKTPGVRHAISRSTGATTWTRKDGDEGRTTCLDHGAEVTAKARGAAWKNGSTPANFCAKCKAIASGKLAKITGDRLPIPHPQGDGEEGDRQEACRQADRAGSDHRTARPAA